MSAVGYELTLRRDPANVRSWLILSVPSRSRPRQQCPQHRKWHCHVKRIYSEITVTRRWSVFAFSMA